MNLSEVRYAPLPLTGHGELLTIMPVKPVAIRGKEKGRVRNVDRQEREAFKEEEQCRNPHQTAGRFSVKLQSVRRFEWDSTSTDSCFDTRAKSLPHKPLRAPKLW